MADTPILNLEPRAVTGKKVRFLRRQGIVPANIFGRGLPSVAVQATLQEFRRVLRVVDRNAVVQAQVAGEPDQRPVVVRELHRHPVTYDVLHIDLYQVDLTRSIHSEARVVYVGEAPAVSLGGVLVHGPETVTLQALPGRMPSEVEVDLALLSEIGANISVGDLTLPPGVEVLTDPATTLASVLAPRVLEEEEEAEAVEGEEVEGEEGEEGEAAEGAEPGGEAAED